MKALIKKIIAGLFDSFFTGLAKRKLSGLSGNKVFFFDIDNTIADTKGSRHLTDVKEFPKMIELVKACAQEGPVFFISARNIITYLSTAKWLGKHNLRNGFPIILLSEPLKKIAVLKAAIKTGAQVVYYDDLCYNHEKGEIKKYDKVIKNIKELDLIYKGIEDFSHLQQP